MNVRFIIYVWIVIMTILESPVYAQEEQGKSTDSYFFDILAEHALILDHESGIVLYEKAAHTPVAPASMSKIMTAEIIFDRLKNNRLSMDTQLPVSENAWHKGGAGSGSSTMFLEPGSRVRVADLLRGVIVQSGNDACIVFAESIAGSEENFAIMMTQKAQSLGLDSAQFTNATGWPDPEHSISLYDLGRLASHIIRSYPNYYPIYAETEFTWNSIKQYNRNPLLNRFPGADGMKTGHTEDAGYSLIGTAQRNGIRRIVIVSGLPNKALRKEESLRLMDIAFNDFKIYRLFNSGDMVGQVPVYMGRQDMVNVIAPKTIESGLHRFDRPNLQSWLRYKGSVVAPVQQGAHIADLIIEAPGHPAQTFPLLAAEDVAEKSSFGKVIRILKHIIEGNK